MALFIDARIPVSFTTTPTPTDALLIEGDGPATPTRDHFLPDTPATNHPAACACCTPRNSAGMAIARLLLARGRGTGPLFTRIVAVTRTQAGRDAILHALEADPIASSMCRQA